MRRSAGKAMELFMKRYNVQPKLEIFYDPAKMVYTLSMKIPAVPVYDKYDLMVDNELDAIKSFKVKTESPFSIKFQIPSEDLWRVDYQEELFDSVMLQLEKYSDIKHTNYAPQDIAELIVHSIDEQMTAGAQVPSYSAGGIVSGQASYSYDLKSVLSNHAYTYRKPNKRAKRVKREFDSPFDVIKKWFE